MPLFFSPVQEHTFEQQQEARTMHSGSDLEYIIQSIELRNKATADLLRSHASLKVDRIEGNVYLSLPREFAGAFERNAGKVRVVKDAIESLFTEPLELIILKIDDHTNATGSAVLPSKRVEHLPEFSQLPLGIEIATTRDVDGLEMGVLKDGTPFLTGRALAKLCGVAPYAIIRWSEIFKVDPSQFRESKLGQMLSEQGFNGEQLFFKTQLNNLEVHAYPDNICMAFLEYYAFEAKQFITLDALNNYRMLARRSLREFIYQATGFDPHKNSSGLDSWKHFHDRLTLNEVPTSHFSVFTETANIVIQAIRDGLIMDDQTVPDISVGKIWSNYWSSNKLDEKYGCRTKFDHNYPDYFRQAMSNPQEIFIYPISALGEFRTWLYSEYIPNKFPKYLKDKVKQGALSSDRSEKLLLAVQPVEFPKPKSISSGS